jgi:hypothetical protein
MKQVDDEWGRRMLVIWIELMDGRMNEEDEREGRRMGMMVMIEWLTRVDGRDGYLMMMYTLLMDDDGESGMMLMLDRKGTVTIDQGNEWDCSWGMSR